MDEPGRLNYLIAEILTNGLILAVGHYLQFDFVALNLVAMFVGRKLGWWLSKSTLYKSPLPLSIALCLGWGVVIGIGLHRLIQEFNPGAIAKVFAYGAAAYTSIPNFALIAPGASISNDIQGRHRLIQVLSFAAFVGMSLWLAFV
jgi:hypothetical protein